MARDPKSMTPPAIRSGQTPRKAPKVPPGVELSESYAETQGPGGETHQVAGNGVATLTTQQGIPVADDQTSLWGDIYGVMRGHHYDGDAYAEGFEPSLDYVDLNAGETAEGWLVFDVPASHGQVVLVNTYDNSKIGTWSF